MLKIGKETDLQSRLIATCQSLGGFGDKIQDKYVKGKADVWLKLPSGTLIFAEVKIVRNARYTISPEFSDLQLDYMAKLAAHAVPIIGIIFTQSPEGYVDFKISSYLELKLIFAKFKKIKYHISHFKRAHDLVEVIKEIEAFFAGSTAQTVAMNEKPLLGFFAELVE